MANMNNNDNSNSHIRLMAYLSILLGMVIVFGVIANFLNILVFSRRSMRSQSSTFRFLLYLSSIDLLVLLISALEAFDRGIGHKLKLREISNFTCKTHTFLTYVLTHTSSIMLMVISVDRALVISNKSFWSLLDFFRTHATKAQNLNGATPRSKRNQSKNHVDIIVLCIVALFMILNSHYLIFLNLVHSTTSDNNNDDEFDDYESAYLKYSYEQLFNHHTSDKNKSTTQEYSEYHYECHPLVGTVYRHFLDKYWNWIGRLTF
jgi:hypothetical protein